MKTKKDRIEIQTLSVFVVLSIITLLFVFALRLVLFAPGIESQGMVQASKRPSLISRGPAQTCVQHGKKKNRTRKVEGEVEVLRQSFGLQDGPCQ